MLGVAALASSRALAQTPSPPPGRQAVAAGSAAQASVGVLKSLAGSWSGTVTTDPPNPDIDGPIRVTVRVAAGGSALVHEIAPGGVPEPTLIYLDGNRLTLVHYCEAGNRPRLVARATPDAKTVAFDFVDISGRREPAYLRRLVVTVADPDRHVEDWTFALSDGKSLYARFDLKRTKESGDGAAAH
jgi:hypothetical protein